MALHPVILISVLYLYTCVAAERNLAEEFDSLKIYVEQLKISHQNEISALKEIIHIQGREINQLKKNHEDTKTLKQSIDRCLSWIQKKAVPNSLLKTGMNTFQQGRDNTVPISKRIRRANVPGEVPIVPFKKNIGDANGRVAFYSYLSHDLVNVGTNQIIIFDRVITNLENLYNNTTGVFYCDRPGTYVFHVHILANPQKTVLTALTKNGERVAYIYAASVNTVFSHGGNTAILQLKRGDSVAVRAHQHASSNGDLIHDTWSSFSGFLLYPDEMETVVVG